MKGDDPFARRLAPKEHHLVLRRRQLMRRHRQEPLLEVGYFAEEGLEPPPGEAAEPGGHQRFGAVGVSIVMGQSEKVPGKKKSGDLPPAVTEEFIELHCARSDGIDDSAGSVSSNIERCGSTLIVRIIVARRFCSSAVSGAHAENSRAWQVSQESEM